MSLHVSTAEHRHWCYWIHNYFLTEESFYYGILVYFQQEITQFGVFLILFLFYIVHWVCGQSRVEGTRLHGRCPMRWTNQIKSAVGSPLYECTRIFTNRERWRDILRRYTSAPDTHNSYWSQLLCKRCEKKEIGSYKYIFTYHMPKDTIISSCRHHPVTLDYTIAFYSIFLPSCTDYASPNIDRKRFKLSNKKLFKM